MKKTYLDHAASTSLCTQAFEVLIKASEKAYANPSSIHEAGRNLEQKIHQYRQLILDSLGLKHCDDYGLIFTSSATESNNMVILNSPQKKEVLYCEADHPSITEPAQSLCNANNSLKKYDLNEVALLDSAKIKSACTTKNPLILLTHVNNLSGSLSDIETIASELKTTFSDCRIHIDAAQSFGKFAIDLSAKTIDSVSLCAHKMGGPKGIAALVYKKSSSLKPLMYGGGQENSLRPSTLSFPLIASWAAAVSSLDQNRMKEKINAVTELRSSLKKELLTHFPQIKFPFDEQKTSAYILTFIHPDIPSDVLVRLLSERGVYVSSSSACSTRAPKFNPKFAALGIDSSFHKNVLRVSFSSHTTKNDINEFIETFKQVTEQLKASHV